MLRYPVLTTSQDFLASYLALVRGAAAATTTAAAAIAVTLAGDHAVGASLDVVVRDIASILGLVPDVVTGDGFASNLAADLDIIALVVGFDDLVAGRRTRATVYRGATDGIRADQRKGRGEGEGQKFKLHDGKEADWLCICFVNEDGLGVKLLFEDCFSQDEMLSELMSLLMKNSDSKTEDFGQHLYSQ